MENPTSPINISTSRQTSKSPPGQQASNLTSALQQAGAGGRSDAPAAWNLASPTAFKANGAPRKDSFGATMAQYSNGSKPITVVGSNHNKPRRESLAGSLVGGMSWGGISVGSWIRDDIIMTGTSPFTLQSPSYHSSSYLPKLEANFMRDFSCCGITLPSLHDLLQHYEEAHAQKAPQTQPPRTSQGGQAPDNRVAGNGMQQNQQQPGGAGGQKGFPSPRPAGNQQMQNQMPTPPQQRFQQQPAFASGRVGDLPDLDIEDMEMDDALADTGFQQSQSQNFMQGRYGQEDRSTGLPALNLGMLQSQGFRSSQPGTPVSPRPLQNNPTVSSVNTPTLLPHSLQQQNSQYRSTPDSSTPGTPAELDEAIVGGLGDMSVQNNPLTSNPSQFAGFGASNDMLELCIDEPAKRLFRQGGNFNKTQPNASFRLGGAQYGPNSEIAQRIREQQRLAGVPDTSMVRPDEEPKPFRCPVIGCEKAYKNQNGLKYHKSHGHNNQQLHDNADGTFSIVNPETATPYPGTLGMEKEKPYRCDVCGKRYKNLNGLKYHKAHSPPCNPELSFAVNRPLNTGGVMQGENINVAGAGLPGIGE